MEPAKDQPSTKASSVQRTPWMIILGVAGIVLATFEVPMPILTCLFLVGAGMDSDLARRAAIINSMPGVSMMSPVLTGLFRLLYGILSATLFIVAWAALQEQCSSLQDRILLAGDLLICLGILAYLAHRSRAIA